MASKALLAKAFTNLGKLLLTRDRDVQKPRIHVVTLGDFLQQPPVRASYFFEPPKYSSQNFYQTSENLKGTKTTAGSRIMRKLSVVDSRISYGIYRYDCCRESKTVVILEEDMRHSQDVTYGRLLERCRLGKQIKEDWRLLNMRYLSPCSLGDEVHKHFESAKIKKDSLLLDEYQSNERRRGINWMSFTATVYCRDGFEVSS